MITATPPIRSDTILDQLIHGLVDGVGARRIILFGSHARGDARTDSDYDLLVEFETDLEPLDAWRAASAAIKSVRPPDVDVDLIVRLPGQFDARVDRPGTIDWDVAREGVVVWPPNAAPLLPRRGATSTAMLVRERPIDPLPYGEPAAGWIAMADLDLDVVEHVLTANKVPWAPVCFHAQQAAEKYLKALLIEQGVQPPRTHILPVVIARLAEAGCVLPDLAAECAVLEPFAVEKRYPDDPPKPLPGEEEGRRAVDAARKIVAAVRSRLR